MVCPGPIASAIRIAPATLMPEDPPKHKPSSVSRLNTIGSISLSVIRKGKIDFKSFQIGSNPPLADSFSDRTPFGLVLSGCVIAV